MSSSSINLVCSECGVDFERNYKSKGKLPFCSSSCSARYHNLRRSKEVYVNKKTKKIECIKCNAIEEVNIRASAKKFLCKSCKKDFKIEKSKSSGSKTNSSDSRKVYNFKLKKCNQCGAIKGECKRLDICKRFQLFTGLNKYFGFDLSLIGTEAIFEEFERIQNLVKEEVWDNKKSILQLSQEVGHNNPRNFTKIIKALNVEMRDLKSASFNAIITGRYVDPGGCHTKYKRGFHTTWDGGVVFYRSSYEEEFCGLLDQQKEKYLMESLRITYWDSLLLCQRIAIPDFYLPDKNEIIEVKSDYTLDIDNMKDKFRAYKDHGYIPRLWLNKRFVDLSELKA